MKSKGISEKHKELKRKIREQMLVNPILKRDYAKLGECWSILNTIKNDNITSMLIEIEHLIGKDACLKVWNEHHSYK
ncbi:hypothetical protein LCGC14_0365140 [marine sediment metagenome]|uniref:Uncharacterized protein n=1 Tax=marine sediment metagenome TaxID=412755 RepID=A0A0F9TPZ0_9ZZZZ